MTAVHFASWQRIDKDEKINRMAFQLEYMQDPEAVRRILKALPEWFGDPEAIEQYVVDAGNDDYLSIVARQSGTTIGVALIRRHFPESAELHLVALSPEARGKGAGRALIDRVAADLANDGCALLSVHTVGPSFDSESYAETRAFYRATDFYPLEEHHNLDWAGPTLILVRRLASVS
ncbi:MULTISPECIES: GNAT family N-acetyltransferase [Micrococcaceae]|uniref:GNAT family N-acetyltransferase n=1 Tax=Micrococcaceae TaxID=1268 RepID=UPI001C7DACF5|nr:GNAT family N-acetyltransferase [Arthrobacter sp. AG1021]